MLNPIYRKSFEKDVKRMQKRGKDMNKLKHIATTLLHNTPLPHKYRDHALVGNYAHHRECHIESDWLLIYKPIPDAIIFERTGTHSDLFK